MAASRVFLFAILGTVIFGWIGAELHSYYYARIGTGVDKAMTFSSHWMISGAIVGAIAGAVQVLVQRRTGNEGL